MSLANSTPPTESQLIPEELSVPEALEEVAEEARAAWSQYNVVGEQLRTLRTQAMQAPAQDRENARRAAAAGDEMPASIEQQTKEALIECRREYEATETLVRTKLAEQAAVLLAARGEWLASLREDIAVRVAEIQLEILGLVDHFGCLQETQSLIKSIELFNGDPRSFELRIPDDRREQRHKDRARSQVRESSGDVEREPERLLAALELLAEQATTAAVPPVEVERPLEETAAGYPTGLTVGGSVDPRL